MLAVTGRIDPVSAVQRSKRLYPLPRTFAFAGFRCGLDVPSTGASPSTGSILIVASEKSWV